MSRTTIPPAPDDVRLGDVPPKGGPVRPVGLVDGLRRPRVLVPILVVLLVGLYLVVVRPLLMPGGDTVWVEYALVVVLALTVVLSVLAAVGTLLVTGLAAIAARTRRHT
jgi:hypothetical protein